MLFGVKKGLGRKTDGWENDALDERSLVEEAVRDLRSITPSDSVKVACNHLVGNPTKAEAIKAAQILTDRITELSCGMAEMAHINRVLHRLSIAAG